MFLFRRKVMQNIVILVEPGSGINCKGPNMILNQFCIDEDTAFESAGVFRLNDLQIDNIKVG